MICLAEGAIEHRFFVGPRVLEMRVGRAVAVEEASDRQASDYTCWQVWGQAVVSAGKHAQEVQPCKRLKDLVLVRKSVEHLLNLEQRAEERCLSEEEGVELEVHRGERNCCFLVK